MVEVLVHFVAPALVGVLIGIASGLLGIGGGTVMVPIFRLAFGMSATMSTATSLFAIIPTSISGAISHVKGKTCIPALGIAAGLGGACLSPVGVWLAQLSPDWLVMLAAALIIGYSAINMFKKAFKLRPAGQPAEGADAAASPSTQSSGAPEGSRTEVRVASATARISGTGETLADSSATSDSSSATPSLTSLGEPAVSAPTADDSSLSRKQLLQGAAIGLVAGLASGYVGVGGGFIMVPLMLSIIGIPMRKASGTSLIAVMILAIPGVIEQGIIRNINYLAGIAIVIGTIPGAVIGARLVTKVPERTLRLLFGCFLIVAAVMLVLNEVGIFG
ncbi:sulfite exporter TauE/SafE family protein [Ellagibacter isourolithinifaciens]|uniref:sulfite exporter TauE/SafE family protein n=1 Tax=Ellagibacter isourolithinifaciens TaxID=2137581 RepID=UPI001B882153|nr:sulfite exporter TauE/SafE family protein [Ellagibacter isourolithinifaciens]